MIDALRQLISDEEQFGDGQGYAHVPFPLAKDILTKLERLEQLETPVVGYVWTDLYGTELILDPDEVTVLRESRP